MTSPSKPRIFLSYARSDLDAALELRSQIEAEMGEGTVWHDVRNLAGDHWWTEIEDAIRGKAAVEHVVLLASAEAMARLIVRREWLLAWREGKALTNVFWSARAGFTPPLLGEQQDFVRAKSMLDLSLPNRWQALLTRLKEPGQGARRPFMAPSLPEYFVERHEEFAKLKAALLHAVPPELIQGQSGNAIAITAALRGAGGFGKTILAQALAHSNEVYETFYDGVLWVSLGERQTTIQLAAKLNSLSETLTGEPQGFTEVSAAANKLREVIAERKCLLVIDDVWSESDLRPFMEGAPLTARLVTTRRDDILPKSVVRVAVDAMKAEEAVELLSQGLGEIGAAEQAALCSLATERLNEWPVIIRLVNGFLRKELERGAPLSDAIKQANDRLDRKKLTVFDRNDETAREAAVESTIRASLDYLVEEIGRGQDPKVYNSQRYDELAVFPEDVEVPIATIASLWADVADVDAINSRDLLKHLYSLALLQDLDLKRSTVRLHDVMRKYLTQKQDVEALKGLHYQFVQAYDDKSGPDIDDTEERRYFYEQYPSHLAAAGEREALDGLLLDPQWMQRKLDDLGQVASLLNDYNSFAQSDPAKMIGKVLLLACAIIAQEPRQLLPQIHARLLSSELTELSDFLLSAKRVAPKSSLWSCVPSLVGPGSEISRIHAHSGHIKDIVSLSDDILLSAGSDNTLLIICEHPKRLSVQSGISAVCRLHDQRIALATGDNSILLMDVFNHSHAEKIVVTTATSPVQRSSEDVSEMMPLASGELATSHYDCSIRIWNVASKAEANRFSDGEIVSSMCQISKSTLAVGQGHFGISREVYNIIFWEIATGQLLHKFEAHSKPISAILVLSDNSIASASGDHTVKIWNAESWGHRTTLQHDSGVGALANLPEGLLVSGCSDGTIHIWDHAAEKKIARLEGHSGGISTLLVIGDSGLVSGGSDGTVRFWDLQLDKWRTKPATGSLRVHAGRVRTLRTLDSKFIISAGDDGQIAVWNTKSARREISAHFDFKINTILPITTHLVALGCQDGKIRLLNWFSMKQILCFGEGEAMINQMCLLSGARIAVVAGAEAMAPCSDVVVWDLERRSIERRLPASLGTNSALCKLPDGRLAAGGVDGIIHIWSTDLDRKELLITPSSPLS